MTITKKDIWKAEIYPQLEKVLQLCKENDIPFFAIAEVWPEEKKKKMKYRYGYTGMKKQENTAKELRTFILAWEEVMKG